MVNEEINFKDKKDLFKAMHGFLSEAKGALIDSSNPHYRSKYASLVSVLNAIKKPLLNWGLIITQTTEINEDIVVLITTLIHESGQSISTKLPLIMGRKDMQALGSALTYARRYSLMSLLSVPSFDDDANEACFITPEQKLELEMLLNGNEKLKLRVLKGLNISSIKEIKYVSFDRVKSAIIKRLEEKKLKENERAQDYDCN